MLNLPLCMFTCIQIKYVFPVSLHENIRDAYIYLYCLFTTLAISQSPRAKSNWCQEEKKKRKVMVGKDRQMWFAPTSAPSGTPEQDAQDHIQVTLGGEKLLSNLCQCYTICTAQKCFLMFTEHLLSFSLYSLPLH